MARIGDSYYKPCLYIVHSGIIDECQGVPHQIFPVRNVKSSKSHETITMPLDVMEFDCNSYISLPKKAVANSKRLSLSAGLASIAAIRRRKSSNTKAKSMRVKVGNSKQAL